MIFVFSSWLIYHLITVFNVCNGERRIIGGHSDTADHTFMVYIIKAETSVQAYSGWLCGGSLVKTRLAITSAACVRDVKHMYLIAGYKHYVTDKKRNDDPCISKTKKKIINVCTPKDYKLNYSSLSDWANLDIAVVKAEADVAGAHIYKEHCDYIPKPIRINYSNSLQKVGTDAMILGWGHTKIWRKEHDMTDFNQEVLRHAYTKIYDKKQCVKKYEEYNIDRLIHKYMICTWPPSSLGEKQDQEEESEHEDSDKYDSKEGVDGCSDDDEEIVKVVESEEKHSGSKKSEEKHSGSKESKNLIEKLHGSVEYYKNQVGICQNDHGGPLISWQLSSERLIGVASVFKVNSDRECEGPFLFTSTYCNSKFLKCVIYELNQDNKKHNTTKKKHTHDGTRRSMPSYCKLPPIERGFEIIERQISWLDHPDGPAETEMYLLRPQIPLQDYLRR